MSAIDKMGINKEQRESIAEGLKRLLADSYTLYLHTGTSQAPCSATCT
jgi:starvation-inducible DNA-binding protein